MVRLIDPAEIGFGGAGYVHTREAESNQESVTLGWNQTFNLEAETRNLTQAGVRFINLRIDRDVPAQFDQFVNLVRIKGKVTR